MWLPAGWLIFAAGALLGVVALVFVTRDVRQGGDQGIHIGGAVVQAKGGPHQAGHLGSVAAQHAFTHLVSFFGGQAQQVQDVGVGAEAAAAHANAKLIPQHGRGEEMRHVLELQRDDAQPLGGAGRVGIAKDTHAGHRRQALQGVLGQLGFVAGHLSHADGGQLADGSRQGHRADGVGAAGLVTVGRLGPGDAVEGDDLHRAAAGHIGVAARKNVAPANDGAGPKGGIHLMGRDRDEIQVRRVVQRAHGHLAVWGQLGAVGQDVGAGGVRFFGQAVDGVQVAGDVAGAGDGYQGHAAAILGQPGVEVGFIQPAIRSQGNVDGLGVGAPGQVVGVVLHAAGQHHVALRREGIAAGQLVDGFGGVFAEDAGMLGRVSADEIHHDVTGLLVGMGG